MVAQLVGAARGGRVASTGFLDPEEADAMAALIRDAGVGVSVEGGWPNARRRTVSAHPSDVPRATPRLRLLETPEAVSAERIEGALRSLGFDTSHVGDTIPEVGGVLVVMSDAAARALLERDLGFDVLEVPFDRLAQGASRLRAAVVASLRVDALGAKAFGVSRSFFAKGIAAGRVRVDGERVGKSSEAQAGNEVWAEGLGRFRILSVNGETRRGNLKVTLEVDEER